MLQAGAFGVDERARGTRARRSGRRAARRAARPSRAAPTAAQTRTRLGLPLGGHGLLLGVLDRPLRRAVGRLPDEDAAGRGGVLETERGDDDVARGHPLAGRVGRRRDRRTPRRSLTPTRTCRSSRGSSPVQLLDRLTDLEGREHRTLGVVAVGDGGAEEGHHGVADVLLDMAAEALDLAPHGLEVATPGRASDPQDRAPRRCR